MKIRLNETMVREMVRNILRESSEEDWYYDPDEVAYGNRYGDAEDYDDNENKSYYNDPDDFEDDDEDDEYTPLKANQYNTANCGVVEIVYGEGHNVVVIKGDGTHFDEISREDAARLVASAMDDDEEGGMGFDYALSSELCYYFNGYPDDTLLISVYDKAEADTLVGMIRMLERKMGKRLFYDGGYNEERHILAIYEPYTGDIAAMAEKNGYETRQL